jgi:integrase
MFAEQWLEHVAHRIKPITLKRYRELLTVHVVPVIGSIHMTELRPAGVQAVVTKVLEHRSPRTAVNTYRVLSEMLGEGVRWGVMATNPALAIRPPRAPRADLHIPDATTCTAILERARGRSVEGALTLALGTGMRLGEILAVRWRDVDLERKACTSRRRCPTWAASSPSRSRRRHVRVGRSTFPCSSSGFYVGIGGPEHAEDGASAGVGGLRHRAG